MTRLVGLTPEAWRELTPRRKWNILFPRLQPGAQPRIWEAAYIVACKLGSTFVIKFEEAMARCIPGGSRTATRQRARALANLADCPFTEKFLFKRLCITPRGREMWPLQYGEIWGVGKDASKVFCEFLAKNDMATRRLMANPIGGGHGFVYTVADD